MVHANGNGDAVTRQLLFDFQYDQTNFELISINHTGTGGNGGVLPAGSTIQLSWQNYPGYGYAGNTTNTNGTTRYTTGLGYSYNATSSNAIIRSNVNMGNKFSDALQLFFSNVSFEIQIKTSINSKFI